MGFTQLDTNPYLIIVRCKVNVTHMVINDYRDANGFPRTPRSHNPIKTAIDRESRRSIHDFNSTHPASVNNSRMIYRCLSNAAPLKNDGGFSLNFPGENGFSFPRRGRDASEEIFLSGK